MFNPKLSYDDVTLIPECLTDIESRKECNPYDEDGMLPIFASCMSSVVSIENSLDFNEAKIRVVIPRSYPVEERINYMFWNEENLNFTAFSMKEIQENFIDNNIFDKNKIRIADSEFDGLSRPVKVCIDLANGHMKKLLEMVKKLKEMYGDKIIIMTGNIANPKTYLEYEKAGVDYVRCSIGTGSVCSTSSNTAIHYPVFSLLLEIYGLKKKYNCKCKIIADGGIKGYRDIQKALIFADYVMIGGLFNKAIESAGDTTYGNFYWNIRGKKIFRPLKTLLNYGKEVPKNKYKETIKLIKENKLSVWKQIYGMSTKIAQALILSANTQSVENLKTSEGLLKYQKVEYDIKGWAENETDYLRSAMSYTNSRTLSEFKDCYWIVITKIFYNN